MREIEALQTHLKHLNRKLVAIEKAIVALRDSTASKIEIVQSAKQSQSINSVLTALGQTDLDFIDQFKDDPESMKECLKVGQLSSKLACEVVDVLQFQLRDKSREFDKASEYLQTQIDELSSQLKQEASKKQALISDQEKVSC